MKALYVLVGMAVEVVRVGVDQVGGGENSEIELVAERREMVHLGEGMARLGIGIDTQRAKIEDGRRGWRSRDRTDDCQRGNSEAFDMPHRAISDMGNVQ